MASRVFVSISWASCIATGGPVQLFLTLKLKYRLNAGAYARGHGGFGSPNGWMIVHNIIVPINWEAILSAENSGKLLSGRGSAQTLLGELTVLPQTDMEPSLNIWPVTRPDPDAYDPMTRLGHWVCFELRDYFDDGVLLMNACFLPKVSGLCSTHPDHDNFEHNCKFIK